MFPQLFHPWVTFLFLIGFVTSSIGWGWFLFASYRADTHTARWSRFLPLLSIRLALEHRETCLKPFLLAHAGTLLCLPQFLRLVAVVSVVEQSVFSP